MPSTQIEHYGKVEGKLGKSLTPENLQSYLHSQIPASRGIASHVEFCSNQAVQLSAPLDVNINHKNTAFGGSLSMLAILAGWSMVFMRLQGHKNEIVIQDAQMSYLKAVTDDFTARCVYQASPQWNRFYRAFEKHGKGRIEVVVQIHCQKELVAEFRGTYVAFNLYKSSQRSG